MVQCIPTNLPGVVIVEPKVFGDDRGFFFESWNAAAFEAAGLPMQFVQDNQSRSQRGVLRGLHFQNPSPQGQLVRVVRGAVFDVAVDLRRSSSTFGQWTGVELNADNKKMLWVPGCFAHGFLCLEDGTDFLYKCDAPYRPEHEHSIKWDDPDIGIDWPLDGMAPILSAKDEAGVAFKDARFFA